MTPIALARSVRKRFAASLGLRVMALIVGVFVLISVPALLSFNWIVDTTVHKLGTLFAERQVLYDRQRGLGTLTREVALAETLARSPAILEWANDEDDPRRKARGIAELEHFRDAFSDHSYFFVVASSGNYYFNDAAGQYVGNQLRYTLSPDNPRDGWFYATAAMDPGCHLNVDHDDVLAVTKVWVNCVVSEGGKVIGVLGTGIDLSVFIRTVVNAHQTGVESIFVDRSGAIQANRDASQIDFHSLTKDTKSKKTIYQLLDKDKDRARLAAMLRQAGDEGRVTAEILSLDGRDVLVGIGYLDDLNWFNVTLMDVETIIDRQIFLPLGLLILLVMTSSAALMGWRFKRGVIDRLRDARHAVVAIESGDFGRRIGDKGIDEISDLSRALDSMAHRVGAERASLEDAVAQRTRQLESLAYLDPMTGILNRRALVEAHELASGHPTAMGLLLIDIDRFKEINDTYGHRAGDEIVVEVADRLLKASGPADFCGRWGGDEFMILLPACSTSRLAGIASRIHAAISGRPIALGEGGSLRVTPSIGAISSFGDTIDAAAHKADLALYRAKREGRDRIALYDPAIDRSDGKPARVA